MMQKIADYDVVQQIGEGTQGSYWLARPPARLGLADEVVAIKTINQTANDAEFGRLVEQLRIYASISSPQKPWPLATRTSRSPFTRFSPAAETDRGAGRGCATPP